MQHAYILTPLFVTILCQIFLICNLCECVLLADDGRAISNASSVVRLVLLLAQEVPFGKVLLVKCAELD